MNPPPINLPDLVNPNNDPLYYHFPSHPSLSTSPVPPPPPRHSQPLCTPEPQNAADITIIPMNQNINPSPIHHPDRVNPNTDPVMRNILQQDPAPLAILNMNRNPFRNPPANSNRTSTPDRGTP